MITIGEMKKEIFSLTNGDHVKLSLSVSSDTRKGNAYQINVEIYDLEKYQAVFDVRVSVLEDGFDLEWGNLVKMISGFLKRYQKH